MTTPVLADSVVVHDSEFRVWSFKAGDNDVPDWAQRLITNPAAWVGGVAPYPTPDTNPLATVKAPVRAATTANVTLSGTQTVDGVALVAKDPVLVKNQTAGADNGVYVVAAGAWKRRGDLNTGPALIAAQVTVLEGGQAETEWIVTTPDPITLGTTAITWAAVGGGGSASGAAGGDLAGTYPNPTVPGLATKAARLTVTAVKTADYTLAANEFVPFDTTSGNRIGTLPTAPPDGTRIGAKHVIQGGSNTVSLVCGGSDVFNKAGGGTTATLPLLNQAMQLQYKATGAIWYIVADDLPLSDLDRRFGKLLFNVETTTEVVNNAALADLVDATVPAGQVVAGDRLQLKAAGTYFNNSGGTRSPVWTVKVGGVSVFVPTVTLGVSTDPRRWVLEVEIAIVSLSVVRMSYSFYVTATSATNSAVPGSTSSFIGEDEVTGLTLGSAFHVEFAVTHGNANASLSMKAEFARLHYFPKA